MVENFRETDREKGGRDVKVVKRSVWREREKTGEG